MRAVVVGAMLGGVLLGCEPQAATAAEPKTVAYTHSGVPWIFDETGHQYLIDTGTPRTFVTPHVAGVDGDTFAVQTVEQWDVRGLGGGREVVVTYDLPPAVIPMVGPSFGGILAADLLAERPFVLDPLRSRLVFDDDGDFCDWLTQTEPPVQVPVQVGGGGTACMRPQRCFEHDGMRMLVDVVVEGTPVVALVDTGSTFTSLGSGLQERLGGDGRPTMTVSRGWDTWKFSRLRTLSIADVLVEDAPVRINPDLDAALARLSVETGQRVELLLGHSVLLQFAVGIDYGRERLTLARYVDDRPLETEMFESFGVWLASADQGCWPVVAVAHGTEAHRSGIDVGDCLLSIDGRTAEQMTDVERDIALGSARIEDSLTVTVSDEPTDGGRKLPARAVRLTKRDLLPRQ
ncbi:MAG: aspartyl protease family protein [Deltaproteobacteria bacterium]|nr:aspartyl protease family protein [Deltaproteobacteria bacterium]